MFRLFNVVGLAITLYPTNFTYSLLTMQGLYKNTIFKYFEIIPNRNNNTILTTLDINKEYTVEMHK